MKIILITYLFRGKVTSFYWKNLNVIIFITLISLKMLRG